MKSWSSSSGSSDTAGRARWARARHAQPYCWPLWLRLPRIGPSPEDSLQESKLPQTWVNCALPQQAPLPVLSTPSLPTLAFLL